MAPRINRIVDEPQYEHSEFVQRVLDKLEYIYDDEWLVLDWTGELISEFHVALLELERAGCEIILRRNIMYVRGRREL